MNVLLIKLGALGDVLRTTPLVPALKQKWPGARVTWLSAEPARPLIERHPDVDKIVTIESVEAGETDICGLSWDAIVNLDEDAAATRIARDAPAREKFGITRNAAGRLAPLSPLAEELIRLASDDRMKFRENQMPYQALYFRSAGLTWMGVPYIYSAPPDASARRARLFGDSDRSTQARAGMFVGASPRYANKFWTESEIEIFCAEYQAAPRDRELVLFGGPGERERLDRLAASASCRNLRRIGVDTLDDLAAAVSGFQTVICGDTLVMHLAEALGVRTVVLFGPTSHTEIFLHGQKVVSPYSCGPCYLRVCGIRPSCMSAITPRRVLAGL